MQRPGTIDTRSVLRVYHVAGLAAGLVMSAVPWPLPASVAAVHVDSKDLWRVMVLLVGFVVWTSGLVAGRFADIEDPLARRRALRELALLLLCAGLFKFAPAWPLLQQLHPMLFAPLLSGGVLLLYLSRAPRQSRLVTLNGAMVVHDKASTRGRYEQSIRRAARQEERARLARDLHDAVKQQLFVIHTAAATVEQRFDPDPQGARSALAQVRASAREALTEMEVMLEQLQAAPIGNTGLIESLKRHCEVLAFRTGAHVRFTPGDLPPEAAFAPGAHQAMLRFAQEALANVARHARARQVTVTLDRQNDDVVLSITDDGQGFDLQQPSRGMGLMNMVARAADAEGSYAFRSAPGEGTTVTLVLQPYAPDRSRFLAWAVAAALFMLAFLALLINEPRSIVYVVVAEAAGALVLIDNAIAWWRARRWP